MKIDIISGFLGAGKTTFIRRLLNSKLKNEKVVLIENEFGEVSVDTDFLADTNIDVKELSQGCICCSLFGDFSKSLKEVVEKFNPDRILIEPSGVGKLSDIIQAVVDAGLQDYLNALVCLVDVNKAKMYTKNFGEFFLDQIKSAHTIVLSRTDIAKEEKANEALEIIRENNHDAVIVTTPVALLKDEELFKAYEGIHDDLLHELLGEHHHDEECGCEHHHHHDEECGCEHHHHHDEECGCEHHHHHDEECGCEHHHHHDEECGCEHHHHHDEECGCEHHHHHDEECGCEHHHHHDEECGCEHHHHHDEECGCEHHHHHADEIFMSIGFETLKKYNISSLKNTLDSMSNGAYGLVVRAKGIVSDEANQWYEFNLTPEEVSVVKCNARPIGKICVIGSKLDEHKIKDLF